MTLYTLSVGELAYMMANVNPIRTCGCVGPSLISVGYHQSAGACMTLILLWLPQSVLPRVARLSTVKKSLHRVGGFIWEFDLKMRGRDHVVCLFHIVDRLKAVLHYIEHARVIELPAHRLDNRLPSR